MSKRFIDSEIFKSPSVRALEAPYKLLWMYLINDCDHAGIWVVDFDIASIYLGQKFDAEEALEALGKKVVEVDGGKRWYLPDFVEFQYGELKPENRVHNSVIDILTRYGVFENKPLTRGSQGCKDTYKDKDKNKDIDKGDSKGGVKRVTKTKPQTCEEVEDYCESIKLPRSDGEAMWDKWVGNGFKNNGKRMNCWKATIRSWKANGYLPSQKLGGMNNGSQKHNQSNRNAGTANAFSSPDYGSKTQRS